MFGDKTVLVTGGTGTFGSAFVKKLMDTATIFSLMLSIGECDLRQNV